MPWWVPGGLGEAPGAVPMHRFKPCSSFNPSVSILLPLHAPKTHAHPLHEPFQLPVPACTQTHALTSHRSCSAHGCRIVLGVQNPTRPPSPALLTPLFTPAGPQLRAAARSLL